MTSLVTDNEYIKVCTEYLSTRVEGNIRAFETKEQILDWAQEVLGGVKPSSLREAVVLVANHYFITHNYSIFGMEFDNIGCGHIYDTDSRDYCKSGVSLYSSTRCDCECRQKGWCCVLLTRDLLTKKFVHLQSCTVDGVVTHDQNVIHKFLMTTNDYIDQQHVVTSLKHKQTPFEPVFHERDNLFTAIMCRSYFQTTLDSSLDPNSGYDHASDCVRYGNGTGGNGFSVPEHAYLYTGNNTTDDSGDNASDDLSLHRNELGYNMFYGL